MAEQIAKGTLRVNEDIIRQIPFMIRFRFCVPLLRRDVEKISDTAYNRPNRQNTGLPFRAHDDITRRGLREQLFCRVKDIDLLITLTLI